jgi:hypothetical protein
MTETKKASDLRVGDVMLVAHMPIGAMSLTTGKFERDEGGGYDEECLIVAVEATTEDGWPKDWVSVDEYGPQRVIAVSCAGKEYDMHFEPDDDVRVKEATINHTIADAKLKGEL